MKHSNISIFIPHLGCKNCCSFCNQRVISGQINPTTPQDVKQILDNSIITPNTQIAFFGGSFTAIDKDYMIKLLDAAQPYNCPIRISTRPDAINQEILDILKQKNVTAIELGAQSMDDEVLRLNHRGHTVKDVENASRLIKQNGFELGLQMMVSLYGDTKEKTYQTAQKIAQLNPDTVRIYPTVILKGTALASLFEKGEYTPFAFEDAVDICANLLDFFISKGILVIKLGLHSSTDVEKDMVGGIYHPAFRELCEGSLYLKIAKHLLKDCSCKNIEVYVNQKGVSKMIGQKKQNIIQLENMGYTVKVKQDNTLKDFQIVVKEVSACT
ncbi:MAG: radical SAM protein [Oscillospiraceae bacterium]